MDNETKTIEVKTRLGPILVEVAMQEAEQANAEPIITLSVQANALVQAVSLPVSVMKMVANTINGFKYERPAILLPQPKGIIS